MVATPAGASSVSKISPWPKSDRKALMIALLLWALPMLVVGIISATKPTYRTVSPVYHEAAENWWAGTDIYTGPGGMNYLPHFAILYSPLHWLPIRVCEVLWRYLAGAATIGGLWLLIRRLFPTAYVRPFLWATILAMPMCMNALKNGNANCAFSGVVVLSIVAILDRRWWLAAGLIALATAVKPLGIVLFLLAPLYYGPLRWRLAIAFVGLLAFPFLFGSPAYVTSQYEAVLANLQSCSAVTEHRFADINGILRTFGTELPAALSRWVRVAAGGATALLWIWGARRLKSPPPALWFYILSTGYLMVFNPMTESNSYGILGPALAAWGAFFLFQTGAGNTRRLGWIVVAIGLSIGIGPNIFRSLFGNAYALIMHPLTTLFLVVMLTAFIARSTTPSLGTQTQGSAEPAG